jgi:hypothetical protein
LAGYLAEGQWEMQRVGVADGVRRGDLRAMEGELALVRTAWEMVARQGGGARRPVRVLECYGS